MKNLSAGRITENIDRYTGKKRRLDADMRYASFDFCYRYFREFVDNDELRELDSESNVQESCTQLAMYLASWGMYRGSTGLLQRSSRSLKPLVSYLANIDPKFWRLDVDSYDDESVKELVKLLEALGKVMTEKVGISPTKTLKTKILLGTLGNIPAFDSRFCSGSGLSSPTAKNLLKISEFYRANKKVIDDGRIHCVEFVSGTPGQVRYPIAKVIDMIYFIEGGR